MLARLDLHDGDVVLVTSKVVSKAEGRVRAGDRDAAIRDETVRVVARRGPTSIVENRLGIVMAAAGVDASNVTPGHVVLLPEDPDASARALRERVYDETGRNVAVIVTDTAGRAWRTGQTDLAVGVGRHRAARRPRRDDRLLRQPAGGHRAGRGRRARLGGRAGHRQARRPADLRRARTRRPGAAPRASTDRVPVRCSGRAAEDMFALGAREAVVAAVRGRDADCFGAPATTEEVLRALESCGLAAAVDGISVRVRLPTASGPATRSWPSNGSAWSRTRTDGGRTATPPRRTVRGTTSRSHPRLRRLQAPRHPIAKADEWPRRTSATAVAPLPSRCARNRQRKERRRSLLILGTCVVVVLGLLGTAVFVYVKDQREEKKAEGTPLAELGVSDVARRSATRSRRSTPPGRATTSTRRPRSPTPTRRPAFGPHWGNYLQGSEIRSFYTVERPPEVERLVHSLEHGHTILWYDDTVKPGTDAYKDVQAISKKFERGRQVHRGAVDRRPTARPSPAASTSPSPTGPARRTSRASRSTAPAPVARSWRSS